MPLISKAAPPRWKPEPGEIIAGQKGKRLLVGACVRDPDKPRVAKIRAMGWFVAYFVSTFDGREHAVNNIRPPLCEELAAHGW